MRFESLEYTSPIGALHLIACDGTLHVLAFPGREHAYAERLLRQWKGATLAPCRSLPGIVDALDAFFRGALRALDRVPVHASGTPFQQRVWTHLRTIAPAETTTYARMARAIGSAAAVRGRRRQWRQPDQHRGALSPRRR